MSLLTGSRVKIFSGAIFFAAFDQVTKWLVNESMMPGESLRLIPGFFQLTLTYNTGAAFSLLDKNQDFLIGLSALIFLLLLIYTASRSIFQRGEVLSLALLLGGTVGNLCDRLLAHHVTDFFDVVCIRYPIFNVADIFILFGALGLFVSYYWTNRTTTNM